MDLQDWAERLDPKIPTKYSRLTLARVINQSTVFKEFPWSS